MRILKRTMLAVGVSVASFAMGLGFLGCQNEADTALSHDLSSPAVVTVELIASDSGTAGIPAELAALNSSGANLDIKVTRSGNTETMVGSPESFERLVSALRAKYPEPAVSSLEKAAGKHAYCLLIHCSNNTEYCHQGSYWNSFFANLDMMSRAVACGGGGSVYGGYCSGYAFCQR